MRRKALHTLLAAMLLLGQGLYTGTKASPAGFGLTVTVTITKNFALDDGIQQDIVTVHVMNGAVIVANLPITFVINGGASGINPVVTTDNLGNAVLSLSSTVAGGVTVDPQSGSSLGLVTVTFVSSVGPPDLTNPLTEFTVDIPSATADGVSPTNAHAHVVDVNGNPVPGVPVVYTVVGGTSGGSAVLTYTGITDINGNVALVITNVTAGTVVISATIGGVAINNSPGTVTFVVGPPSTSNPATALVVDVGSTVADGVSMDQLHAHVVDATGNAVAGATVVFSIAGGTAGATAHILFNAVTDASGNAYINATNTVTGTVLISATIGGVQINNSPATVVFVAGAPSLSSPATQLIVDVGSTVADGVSTDQVHAHVVDASGNPVAGATVVFTVSGGTSGGTAVIAGTGITDASGNASLTITNTVTGTVFISATIGGVAINNSPATVVFVAGPPSTSNPATQLIVDIGSTVADGVSTDQVHAHVVDASGNPVAGATVVFTVAGGTAGGTAVIAGTGITDASGNTILTITDVTAGTVSIAAKIGGVAISGSPATVNFVSGAPDLSQSVIIIDQNNSPADNSTPDIVHAHIVDAMGNPVAGQTIVFSITSGTAGFTGPVTVTTDASGNASIALTSGVAGSVDVAGTAGGTPLSNSPVTVNFQNLPDLTNPATALIVVVYEALADGTTTTSVKAHIVDQNGNILSGVNVVFALDSGTAQILTTNPVTTDVNGDATILISSKTPGYVLITATVNNQPIVNGSPARVKFAPINIYVPRVFTPNGDGTNDVLKPVLVGITSFHYFSIYNRWGNLLFQTQDPTVGWDGRVKGVPQPVETYLWIAEGIDINGKKVVQKGMVSLVR
jgi:adhesin/invasin